MLKKSLQITLGMLFAVSVGCAGPQWNRQVVARETFTVNSPSLVMAPKTPQEPDSAYSTMMQGPFGGQYAWWQNRNDRHLNVRPGYRGPEVESYAIHTRDQQRIINGRIDNSYRRTVHSLRTGGHVR